MSLSPHAGKKAPKELLIDQVKLTTAYYAEKPDAGISAQRVAFGTSGHRGSSLSTTFNEDHILAISQAIVEWRASAGITGPLYMGKDTHALSEPSFVSAVEVMAASGVELRISPDVVTPTPAISHAILCHNRSGGPKADGVVITPSHNPPRDGGFKYNPPNGGPADTDVTRAIAARANELLENGLKGVKRLGYRKALAAPSTQIFDFVGPYVEQLSQVVNLDAVAQSGLRIGVDPLGGSSMPYWEPIAERYGLNLTLVNRDIDPSFSFMSVDHDGKIRMDCSSPYAMAGLLAHKDSYDIAFGNDPDADRHGIVTASHGLLNPNHYLAVAADYLFTHRPGWPAKAAVGKTVVTSSMLERVAAGLSREVVEVPVGFKWFVQGLSDGSLGFGCEESAGASFLRFDGSPWSTDKDGLILNLLAAEITAVMGANPGQLYEKLEARYGRCLYARKEAPANAAQKAAFAKLTPELVTATELAGEPIRSKLTKAAGASIGGLKVKTDNGWFAARPSGTEEIYKIYAESFLGEAHLQRLLKEAQEVVSAAFESA